MDWPAFRSLSAAATRALVPQRLAVVSLLLNLCAAAAAADDDPCANYAATLAYTRSSDDTPVDLTVADEKAEAELTLRIPRTFVANAGNLRSGKQCGIALEVLWPELLPAGPIPFEARQVHDRWIGDMLTWRPLTILIQIDRRIHAPWFVSGGYCGERLRRPEVKDRPFGLRAFDDGLRWPLHRQTDGSYRNMQELTAYPLNLANTFYFVDGPVSRMARISCSKGAVRCIMEDSIGGFRTKIFFDADDLAHWRDYQSAVRDLVSRHVTRSTPAKVLPDPGTHANPPPALLACLREMLEIAGPESQIPTLPVHKN